MGVSFFLVVDWVSNTRAAKVAAVHDTSGISWVSNCEFFGSQLFMFKGIGAKAVVT